MDKKKKSAGSSCEYCMNYEYDEDYEYYVCTQDLDQDEMYRFITGQFRECPYYRAGDCKKADVNQNRVQICTQKKNEKETKSAGERVAPAFFCLSVPKIT